MIAKVDAAADQRPQRIADRQRHADLAALFAHLAPVNDRISRRDPRASASSRTSTPRSAARMKASLSFRPLLSASQM